ncbi:hypothetical protein JTB14_017570 [Gonioctena quinquepunctata]|nr:hypothetical protein JTB14_017570 [Gonioctena quinquepunctata]
MESENDSDGDNDCEITNAEAEFNFDGDNIILSDRENETPLPMDTWDPEDLLPLSQLKAMGKIQWCKIDKITPPEDFKKPFGVAQDIKDLRDIKSRPSKDFRRSIIDHLVADKLVPSSRTSTELTIPIKKKKRCQSLAMRLTQSAHQPVRTSQRRCALCSSGEFEIRTNWLCSVCEVPLCLGKNKTCFQTYHSNFK